APPTGGTTPNRPTAALPACSAFEPNGIVGALGITDEGAPGMPPGDATFDAGIPKPLGRPGAALCADDVGTFDNTPSQPPAFGTPDVRSVCDELPVDDELVDDEPGHEPAPCGAADDEPGTEPSRGALSDELGIACPRGALADELGIEPACGARAEESACGEPACDEPCGALDERCGAFDEPCGAFDEPCGALDEPPCGALDEPEYGALEDPPYGALDEPEYGALEEPPYGALDGPEYGALEEPPYGALDEPCGVLDEPGIAPVGTNPNGAAHGFVGCAPSSAPKSGGRSSDGVPHPVDVPPGPACDVLDSLALPDGPPATLGDGCVGLASPCDVIATSCGVIVSASTLGAPGTFAISCGIVSGDAGADMPRPVVSDSGVGCGTTDAPEGSSAIRASIIPIVFGSSAANATPGGASAAPASPGVELAMLGPGLCGTPPASPRSPICANNARSSCGGR
ncbi:MAG: hypothetical protein H0V17_05830, partial [Deltaproteobacteria bacterium]|nr:hypothetical protein [Deltaproteobacteria bacterium]